MTEEPMVGYTGVHVHEVALALEDAAPAVPAGQRGAVARHILDSLYSADLLAGSSWRSNAAVWHERALADGKRLDSMRRQHAVLLHSRAWETVKAHMELEQAMKVVRSAQVLYTAVEAGDADAVSKAQDELYGVMESWLEFNYTNPDTEPGIPIVVEEPEVVEPVAEETAVLEQVEPVEEASEPTDG